MPIVMSQSTENFRKRQKRKFLQGPILEHLAALDSPFHKKYIHSFTCSSLIENEGGKCRTMYCKRPWCSICAPIRTAVRINNYKEQLEAIGALELTTLTMPNVPAWEIRASIALFRKIFKQFRNSWNKRNKDVFKGVYNFEITINPITRLYHPHIHIIHQSLGLVSSGFTDKKGNEQFVNELVNYWLEKCPDAAIQAQDSRVCTELIEGFKYSSKGIYTTRVNGKLELVVMAEELDAMYREIANLRLFQAFGICRVMSEEEENEAMDKLEAYCATDKPDGSYLYNKQKYNWFLTCYVNPETGEFSLVHHPDFDTVEIPLVDTDISTKSKTLHDKLARNEHYKPLPKTTNED